MKNSLKNNKCSKEEAYDILREFLKHQNELSRRKEIDETSFDTPNWAFYQAYQAGFQKALSKVLEFLPDQERTK